MVLEREADDDEDLTVCRCRKQVGRNDLLTEGENDVTQTDCWFHTTNKSGDITEAVYFLIVLKMSREI